MTLADGLKRSPWYTVNGYQARTVTLSDGHQTTELQHRVVMEAHLGRRLATWEHVHHRDGDRSNNDLSNLEVLSAKEHAERHAHKLPPVELTCLLCGAQFQRKANWERNNRKRGKVGPFCGKRCAGRYSRKVQLEQKAVTQ